MEDRGKVGFGFGFLERKVPESKGPAHFLLWINPDGSLDPSISWSKSRQSSMEYTILLYIFFIPQVVTNFSATLLLPVSGFQRNPEQ
jgi:hypothetical protein